MTVDKIIERVDKVKPNGFPHDVKVDWIKELIAKIKEEVVETHESYEEGDDLYVRYVIDKDEDITGSTEIDLPDSHMDVAEFYLYLKIDLANADIDRYSNSLVLFNNAYLEYRRWYNRHHMPKGVR